MTLLTDTDLVKRIVSAPSDAQEDSILIDPYEYESLTPVGYDLRVGTPNAFSNKPGRQNLREGEALEIEPGATALITTLENIEMPKNLMVSGLIESKVTKVSLGLSHISTTVDPDWSGNLLIAVHNHSSEKFRLEHGETFCTMVFLENSEPSTKKCEKLAGRQDALLNMFDETAKRSERERSLKHHVKVKRLTPEATIPRYAHSNDAGMDLFSSEDVVIRPRGVQLVKTGIAIELPGNTEAQIRPRSGLAIKGHITVLNSPGTIDQSYRGEIGVILINHGEKDFSVRTGMRIAQMVIKPVLRLQTIEVDELSRSGRGTGGFGSTGE